MSQQPAPSDPVGHDVRTVSIPKKSMPIRKFLRHAELVPSKFAASIVCTGNLVKVNGDHNAGSVRAGDTVTVARLPTATGEPVSWEPQDVINVRVVGS